jgi:hypothetical protein
MFAFCLQVALEEEVEEEAAEEGKFFFNCISAVYT